jgi:signal peptidase II
MLILSLFCLFLLGVDVVTKILAIHFIPPLEFGAYPFGGIGIFSIGGVTFSLNYIVNTGAAWGIFAGHSGFLFLLRVLIILGIFFFAPKRWQVWLILVGAIGNAIDYCLYGHVVDFLHFTFWGYSFPVFNIADSCITIGALSLLFLPNRVSSVKIL